MKRYFVTFIALFLLVFSSIAQIPSGYYDNAEGLSGEQLKTALHNIIKGHTSYPYTSSSTDTWDIIKEADRDPNNSNNVILIYKGNSVNAAQEYNNGAGWNREHVWAKSHGDFGETPPAGTDIHHLKASDISVNADRGNLDFDNGGSQHSEATGCYYDSDSWEPRDAVKGDVARMMFYMATRYEGDVSGEPDLELVDYITGSTTNPIFGKLSTLLEWHAFDPVDDFERNRNEVVYSYQNNRNPFIDHPEYVSLIWGGETPAVSFTSTPSSEVTVGEAYTYNITTSGGNGSPITITCDQKPAWLSFSGGTNGTASLSGTPTETDEGIHTVVLTATDAESSAEQSFSITVNAIPTSLVFISSPITSASVNQQYSYTVEAIVEGNESAVVSFEGVTIPTWLNFTDQGDGSAILYGTPTETNIGSNNVQISATSGDLQTSQSFSIQVSSGGSGGEFVETFELMPESSTSYASREWTGDNGIQWSATNARTDQEIDSRAICLKDLAGSYLLSQTLSNGVSTISFDHQQMFTGSGGEITLFINDQQVGDPVLVTSTAGNASFSNINVSGDFTIKLVSNGLSRIAIDNLSWTNLSTAPQSPVFGEISHTPSNPTSVDQSVSFSAVVTDPDGTIQSVNLLYGNSSENLDQNLAMTTSGNDIYTVSSQMPLDAGDVYYKIEATDNEANTSVSPQFIITAPAIQFTFEVNIVGEGSVTVNGNPYTGQISANDGTVFNLSASPSQGYVFDGWTGDLSSSQSSESITLISNMSVTATFVTEPQFPVIVEVSHTPTNPLADEQVTFYAEVTDTDGTVDEVILRYGNTSGLYDQSLSMTLSSQDIFSTFSIMPLNQGEVYYIVEATDNDNNITTSIEYSIVAATPQYEIEISIIGEGNVSLNGNLYTEPVMFDEMAEVSLVASPSEGYKFDGWNGDLISTEESESITMNEDKLIVATFSIISSVDQNSTNQFMIYPNPFHSHLKIDNSDRISRVMFINVLGERALVITNPTNEISTSKLSKGLYLIAIEDINGNLIYSKVLKE